MDLPEFSEFRRAVVVEAREAATRQAWITVEPPADFIRSYERAGQFCKMRVDDLDGIFAMFSAPGEQPVQFLVRVENPDGGEAADRLFRLSPGSEIGMTLPAGSGFDLRLARGRDVYFVATGTGVAPVRAALEWVLAHRNDYGDLFVDYGVRSTSHLAIAEDIERWRAAHIDVRVSFSNPDPRGGLRGRTVQQSLRERQPNLSKAAVIAVGQPEMLDELLTEIVALGGDPELFLKNI